MYMLLLDVTLISTQASLVCTPIIRSVKELSKISEIFLVKSNRSDMYQM